MAFLRDSAFKCGLWSCGKLRVHWTPSSPCCVRSLVTPTHLRGRGGTGTSWGWRDREGEQKGKKTYESFDQGVNLCNQFWLRPLNSSRAILGRRWEVVRTLPGGWYRPQPPPCAPSAFIVLREKRIVQDLDRAFPLGAFHRSLVQTAGSGPWWERN